MAPGATPLFQQTPGSAGLHSLRGGQEFRFRLKATHPGTYRVAPARLWGMYEPDRQAWSRGFVLKVER